MRLRLDKHLKSSEHKWKCSHWHVTNASDINTTPALDSPVCLPSYLESRMTRGKPTFCKRYLQAPAEASGDLCKSVHICVRFFFSGKMIYSFNQHLKEIGHPKRLRATLWGKLRSTSFYLRVIYSIAISLLKKKKKRIWGSACSLLFGLTWHLDH